MSRTGHSSPNFWADCRELFWIIFPNFLELALALLASSTIYFLVSLFNPLKGLLLRRFCVYLLFSMIVTRYLVSLTLICKGSRLKSFALSWLPGVVRIRHRKGCYNNYLILFCYSKLDRFYSPDFWILLGGLHSRFRKLLWIIMIVK
jgi:hypothetical protein